MQVSSAQLNPTKKICERTALSVKFYIYYHLLHAMAHALTGLPALNKEPNLIKRVYDQTDCRLVISYFANKDSCRWKYQYLRLLY